MRARRLGLVHERRDLPRFAVLPVECRELDQPRGHERPGFEAALLARGPGFDLVARHVEHEGIARLPGAGEAEGEPLALDVEAQRIDDPAGKRRRYQLLVSAQIEQVELAQARLVDDVREVVAIPRNGERLDVPGNVSGDLGLLAGVEVDEAQPFHSLSRSET